MSRLKSANLLVGIALFTLVALPMVYVLSMPVAFKLMSDDQDFEYGIPFYAPLYSTLNDHPELMNAYALWSQPFGMDTDRLQTMNFQNNMIKKVRAEYNARNGKHDNFWHDYSDKNEWTQVITHK